MSDDSIFWLIFWAMLFLLIGFGMWVDKQ